MAKLSMKLTLILIMLIAATFLSCNNNDVVVSPTTAEDSLILTGDKILAARPSFPDDFPTAYILGDTSYIRIVCNRNVMEKVWMVYYDTKDQKWSTIIWTGSGENNEVIGDTLFTRENGLKGGHSTDDAPLFYMAYSLDSGRTWIPQHNYEANYSCKNNQRSYRTSVLVSNDYINTTGRCGAAIIIQNKKQGVFRAQGREAAHNFDFLCPVTRKF